MGEGTPKPTIDQMVEFAVAELASGDDDRLRALVRTAAMRWPDERALALCFAVTSAASSLEDTMRGVAIARSANQAYRLAALIAADVLAIETMRPGPAFARDLLHYWRRVDPYFLDL